jgi:hypothetical protein
MELKTAIKENQNKDHPNHKEKAQTVKDLLKLKEKDKRDKKERAERPKIAVATPTQIQESTQSTQKAEKMVTETPRTTPAPSALVISKTGKTIDDLILAQNKTTHAVRAFVRFLFIQLTGITLAFFLWNLSLAFVNSSDCIQSGENCSGNVALQFLAVGVWIATVIVSSNAGWDELKKSEIG